VIVTSVTPSGVFGKAGVEPGDIILQVNDEQVSSEEDFAAALGAVPSHTRIVLTVVDHRSGSTASLMLMTP